MSRSRRKKRRYIQLADGTWVREPKQWKRRRKTNRHHIINKCRGGTWNPKNIINLDYERHSAWHFLFHNLSFREVIELLERALENQERKQ